MIAEFYGECRRCPDPIQPGDDIVIRPSGAIHRGCASGGDDE